MSTNTVPEQGQLVEVRKRQYIVTDVSSSTLPISPLDLIRTGPQHLVSLVSIEDDALGEELRVIWELEPGAQIRERSTLPAPTAFDLPLEHKLFLTATPHNGYRESFLALLALLDNQRFERGVGPDRQQLGAAGGAGGVAGVDSAEV